MFWPEVNFKGKNDPLSWIAFKQIKKKKKKKKKKAWKNLGLIWSLMLQSFQVGNW